MPFRSFTSNVCPKDKPTETNTNNKNRIVNLPTLASGSTPLPKINVAYPKVRWRPPCYNRIMPQPPISDLLRHAELRAAVILAGKETRKLNVGKKGNPVL